MKETDILSRNSFGTTTGRDNCKDFHVTFKGESYFFEERRCFEKTS